MFPSMLPTALLKWNKAAGARTIYCINLVEGAGKMWVDISLSLSGDGQNSWLGKIPIDRPRQV